MLILLYMDIALLLIIIGGLFIFTELIVGVETGFDLLLLGTSLLIGGVVGFYTSDQVAAVTAGVLSLSYVVFGRKYIKNKMHTVTHTSNVDTLIGKTVVISKWDPNSKVGSTNLNGESWRVVSHDELFINQEAVIQNVEGVSLVVKGLKKE